MDLHTKYDDLGDEKEKGKKAGLENTASKGSVSNIGTGPAPNIADGGVEGEAKQPKENTGNMTDMGGATGGTAKSPDESEGNDNPGT